jgi:hypothetical protein
MRLIRALQIGEDLTNSDGRCPKVINSMMLRSFKITLIDFTVAASRPQASGWIVQVYFRHKILLRKPRPAGLLPRGPNHFRSYRHAGALSHPPPPQSVRIQHLPRELKTNQDLLTATFLQHRFLPTAPPSVCDSCYHVDSVTERIEMPATAAAGRHGRTTATSAAARRRPFCPRLPVQGPAGGASSGS